MKIAIVTTEFVPFRGGGIGTYCESICRALVDRGHEVHILTSVPGEKQVYGATVHRLSIPNQTTGVSVPWVYRDWYPDYLSSYYWARELEKIVNTYGIDVIECQECMAPMYFYLYRRHLTGEVSGPPVVIHLHTPAYEIALWDHRPIDTPGMHLTRFMEDFCIRSANAILSPSRFLASYVVARLPEIKEKLEVIPYPSYEQKVNLPENPAIGEKKEIVYVGRLEHRKGIEVLVEAIHKLMLEDPEITINFIGKSEFSFARATDYRQWAAGKLSHFADRVIFSGVLSRYEIMEKMRAASCVVIPSIGENFPNVCMEAMLSGSVIVASDSGGMAEMIEDGKSGFLFTGSDVDALTSRIKSVLDIPRDNCNQIRLAAQQRIVEFCNIDRIVKKRERHYEEVVEARRNHDVDTTFPVKLFLQNYSKPVYQQDVVDSLAAVILYDGVHSDLNETINSLMANTWRPHEIVLVNCSGKNEQLGRPGELLDEDIKFISISEYGKAAARNAGVEKTTAGAILFLDAGLSLEPSFLESAMDILNRHPEIGLIQCWGRCGKQLHLPVVPFFPMILYEANSKLPAGLVRRRAFAETDGFTPSFSSYFYDWELTISLMEHGWLAVVIPEILLNYKNPINEFDTHIESGVGNVLYAWLSKKHKELFSEYNLTLINISRGLMFHNRLSRMERQIIRYYRYVRHYYERLLNYISR